MHWVKKIMLAVVCVLIVWSCNSQDMENPKTLGGENFRLEKLTFNEKPAALFGKNKYYKTTISDDDGSVIAYNYIISKKDNPEVKVSLGDIDVSRYKYDFKVNKQNMLIGVSISFTSKQNMTENILKNINNEFGKYRIDIYQAYENPSVYRWESSDKIIHFTCATSEGEHVYSISILSRKFDCSSFPLERVFVGEDICLKKYTRNK